MTNFRAAIDKIVGEKISQERTQLKNWLIKNGADPMKHAVVMYRVTHWPMDYRVVVLMRRGASALPLNEAKQRYPFVELGYIEGQLNGSSRIFVSRKELEIGVMPD